MLACVRTDTERFLVSHLLGHLEKNPYLPHPVPLQMLYQSFLKKLQWAREETISERYYTLK